MIMGFTLCDGEVSRLAKGRRAILGRDDATGTVTRVLVEGVDELGRELHAEGECVTRFVNLCNENLVGWNHLVRWDVDGVEAWGEQHENYSTSAFAQSTCAPAGWYAQRLAASLIAAAAFPRSAFVDSRLMARPLSSVPARVAVRMPFTSMARCTVRLLICRMSDGIVAMRCGDRPAPRRSSSAAGNARFAMPSAPPPAP